MVAGGGGANLAYTDVFPHAGALYTKTIGAKISNQVSGYMFGIGKSAGRSGGGGGYYGGDSTGTRASGGSSYISGHLGCNSISENSTQDNIIHTGSMIHYSGKYFLYTQMEPGYSYMPAFDGSNEIIGNYGNGYVKITRMVVE